MNWERQLLSLLFFDLALRVSDLLVRVTTPLPDTLPPAPPMSQSEVLALCADVGDLRETPKKARERSSKRRKASSAPPSDRSPPLPETPASDLSDSDQLVQDAVGARTLLVEVMKRAAYDWVLYRSSTRLPQKKLAEDAYIWLFLEQEGHLHWRQRQDSEKQVTSFLAICEVFDLDPEDMRRRFRTLTPSRVLSFGRPPSKTRDEGHGTELRSFVDLPPENEEFFDGG
jgi:hypothetical protein